MAVRVAMFHEAPRPKGPTRRKASTAADRKAKADPTTGTGALARARARLRPKPAEPEPPRKPARKPAAKPTAATRTKARPRSRSAKNATAVRQPATIEKSPSRFRRSTPRPAAEAEGTGAAKAADAPRRPVLQRRSFAASLARAAVMAVAIVLMVAFAVALAKVTLVPSPASVHLIHTNLRPGASIRAYLDQPELRDSVKQIGGNIVLGVPFGILLPMLFPRARGLLRVAVITAFVMVLVEATQGAIVEGRAFDIDDVILNTFGALLGYLFLGRRLGRALHPRRNHWYQRAGRRNPPPPED
jgi:hypothetical protein